MNEAPTKMLPWLIACALENVRLVEQNRLAILAHYGDQGGEAYRANQEVVNRRETLAQLQESLRLSRHA